MPTFIKRILFFVLLFATLPSLSFAQWNQTKGPEGGYINTFERIGKEIWVGTKAGIYISKSEGASWIKSKLITSDCSNIICHNDTIVIVYSEDYISSVGTSNTKTYSITSFNKALSWSVPKLISSNSGGPQTKLHKIGNKLMIQINSGQFFMSNDHGINWSNYTFPLGSVYIQEVNTDKNSILVKATQYSNNISTYYLSKDETASWQSIDSSNNKSSAFINDSIILFSGNYYDTTYHSYIVRTKNMGVSIDTVFKSPAGAWASGFATIGDSIFCFGSFQSPYIGNEVYLSTDKGQTWKTTKWLFNFNYWKNIKISNGNFLQFIDPKIGVTKYISSLDTFYSAISGMPCQNINSLYSNNKTLFAGTQYELYKSDDAGETWSLTNLPSQPINGMVFINDTIIAANAAFIQRSFDNGLSWDTLHTPCSGYIQDVISLAKINNRIFYSGDSIFYSDNLGKTWNRILPWTSKVYGTCYTSSDQTGYLKVLNNELYVVSNDGFIFKYDSILNNFQFVYCFWSTGAFNRNRLYQLDNSFVLSGRGEFSVSNDNGLTWNVPLLNGLPIIDSIMNEKIHPKSMVSINGLWIGTCGIFGVYVSTDKGDNWAPIQQGNAPFISQGLVVMDSILYAGSYYSGVWKRANSFVTLSGIVYLDKNNNGVKDVGEQGLPDIIIKTSPTNWVTTTDSIGHYSLQTDARGDALSPCLPVNFSTASPLNYMNSGTNPNLNFGIFVKPDVRDLTVDLTNTNVFRPGFETELNLTIQNKGSVNQSAQLQLILDNKLQFDSSIPSPATISGDTLRWNLSTLTFLEKQTFSVTVTTSPFANIGDSIYCFAKVDPINLDSFPTNNVAYGKFIIVGAYDPNDKTCLQGIYFSPSQINSGEDLVFTIRFQNTGNYPATIVKIIDTLSNYLDISTFQILSQSHLMTWSLSNNGVINFLFDNINLPDSSSSELNSHGYVKYSIRCKKSLRIGNVISNTAFIYFDYNPPITTNATTTLIANKDIVGIASKEVSNKQLDDLKIYPNPASDFIYLNLSDPSITDLNLCIYNLVGESVLFKKINSSLSKLTISSLSGGMYIGVLSDNNNHRASSFRFVVRN